jgi:hypothetical protein
VRLESAALADLAAVRAGDDIAAEKELRDIARHVGKVVAAATFVDPTNCNPYPAHASRRSRPCNATSVGILPEKPMAAPENRSSRPTICLENKAFTRFWQSFLAENSVRSSRPYFSSHSVVSPISDFQHETGLEIQNRAGTWTAGPAYLPRHGARDGPAEGDYN